MKSIEARVRKYCLRLSLALMTAFPLCAEAKILYVNTATGNDSTTYASNNESNPWRTIGRAAWGSTNPNAPNSAQAAVAGDVVLIADGTYNTVSSGTGRFEVALNPANEGTSSNPIIFRGVGNVIIHLAAGYAGPTIGANNRDYIVWDNVIINEANAGGKSVPDTGSVVLFNTTGSQIINCSITGALTVRQDNYNAIRMEIVTNPLIRNNTISGVRCTNTSQNCAAIMTYDAASAVIEHNDISNSDSGIYIKGDHGGDGFPSQANIIRFNRLSSMAVYGVALGAAHQARVYQNIIKGAKQGIRIYGYGGLQSTDMTIQNNTIISTNQAGEDHGISNQIRDFIVNLRVYNNIFYGSFSEAVNFGVAAPGDIHFRHNVYSGYNVWGSVSGTQRTFAYWQGTAGQDSAPPAGITYNPMFIDEVDYKLQAGSPARTLGVDILDLNGNGSTSDTVPAGAYITGNEVIGLLLGSGSSDALPPMPPANLRVQ